MFQDPTTMSLDPSSLESDLRQLRAAALDEALLARLEACAANTWTTPDPEEIRFEQQLLATAPAKLPAALMASLEATLRDRSLPRHSKHRPLPDSASPHSPPSPRLVERRRRSRPHRCHHRPPRARPACTPPNSPRAPAGTHTTLPAITSDKLFPADFNRGLTEARDEGVVWQSNTQPHRVLKVVYTRPRDAQGRRRPQLSDRTTARGIYPRPGQIRLSFFRRQ